MLSKRPKAAIIAPPGMPGAATIVTPSINIKGNRLLKGVAMPFNIMTVIAQLVSVIVLPDKWMVAQRGTANSAIPSSTPFNFACRNVTGIVAAEDWVPMAVKYAGIIVLINLKGLEAVMLPAIRYWIIIMVI